jgi:Fe-S-cluster formation regulator IscX/YfhJ
MQTDRWTDMKKLIVALCSFENVPKNEIKVASLYARV